MIYEKEEHLLNIPIQSLSNAASVNINTSNCQKYQNDMEEQETEDVVSETELNNEGCLRGSAIAIIILIVLLFLFGYLGLLM